MASSKATTVNGEIFVADKFLWVPLPTKIKHTKICLQPIIKAMKISHVRGSEELGEDDAVAVPAPNRWSTRLHSRLGITCLLATGLSHYAPAGS